jgi:hypothetical protein
VTRGRGGSDGPEDVDAAFAEIVADLEREGLGAALVEEDGLGRDLTHPDLPHPDLILPDFTPPDFTLPDFTPPDLTLPDLTLPDLTLPDLTLPDADPSAGTPPGPAAGAPAAWRPSNTEWDPDAVAQDEHFVPPEPPPLPRLRPGTVFGIALLAIGVLLLAGPNLIGLAPKVATPLALVSMAAGIGWLVLRMRQGPPPDSGWDDGAQL